MLGQAFLLLHRRLDVRIHSLTHKWFISIRVCQQETSNQSPGLIYYSHAFRISSVSNINIRLNDDLVHIFNFRNSIWRKSLRLIEQARLASLQLKVRQIADWWLKLMASNLESLTLDLLEVWGEMFWKRMCMKWIDWIRLMQVNKGKVKGKITMD